MIHQFHYLGLKLPNRFDASPSQIDSQGDGTMKNEAIAHTGEINAEAFDKALDAYGLRLEELPLEANKKEFVLRKKGGTSAKYEVCYSYDDSKAITMFSFREIVFGLSTKSDEFFVRGSEDIDKQVLNALRIYILETFKDVDEEYEKMVAEPE